MIKYLLIIITFLPVAVFSQETKMVTKESNKPWSREVFYVLKSDKKTKHGNYQNFAYKNAVRINGYYKDGLKDSTWTEYHWQGKIKSMGTYKYDKQIGIWEYYDRNGELVQKYNYTENKLIFNKENETLKDKEFSVINGSDTIKTKLDQSPIYIGGTDMMLDAIATNIKYPKEAREAGIAGIVYITFTIDKNGKTSNHTVTKGIASVSDYEALRVVKLIPDKWIPGQINGQSVNTEFVCPISFRLQ